MGLGGRSCRVLCEMSGCEAESGLVWRAKVEELGGREGRMSLVFGGIDIEMMLLT